MGIEPLTIEEFVRRLRRFADEDADGRILCVYARRPWRPSSEARVLPEGEPPPGMDHLLEVFVAREVLEDFEAHPLNVTPTRAAHLLVYYAENDAFPPWSDIPPTTPPPD